MSKPYIYITEDAKDRAQEIVNAVKDIDAYNAAVFIIGENPDIPALKKELNFVNDKKQKLFCVAYGENDFDAGLKMQFGLAEFFAPAETGKLAEALKNCTKPGPNKTLIIAIAAVVVIAIAAAIIIPNLGKKEQPQEDIIAHNMILDDVYLKAFIDQGLDCIVKDGGISKEELLQAEKLDLSGLGITDVEPLVYATNLKELNLSNNKITDITKLAALDKLEKIDLSGNQIQDISVLQYLPKLTEVIYDDEQ